MGLQSKSAIAIGDGSFIIEHVDIAKPHADEVLVQIKAAGLCHTDHDALS